MTKFFRSALLVACLVLFLVAPAAHAVSWLPLVPCGHSGLAECGKCDIFKLFKNLIDLAFLGIAPIGGTLIVLYAGFKLVLEPSPATFSKVYGMMKDAAMGLLILGFAWLFTSTLLKTFAKNDDLAEHWWQLTCKEDVPAVPASPLPSSPKPVPSPSLVLSPSPGPTKTPTKGPAPVSPAPSVFPSPSQALSPSPSLVLSPSPSLVSKPSVAPSPSPVLACQFTNIDLCQPRSMTCGTSSCAQYDGYIAKYAGGAAEVNLIKAIMMKESSCNPRAASSSSYGLMQIQPSTANLYRSRCGVTETITSSWLTDPAHAEQVICLGAEYIRALSQGTCGGSVRTLAAGYNGGAGACQPSRDCAGTTSCGGGATERWECLYDDGNHTTCNTGYDETRDYATKVQYCYQNPGF